MPPTQHLQCNLVFTIHMQIHTGFLFKSRRRRKKKRINLSMCLKTKIGEKEEDEAKATNYYILR